MFLITENDKVSGDCKALNARPAANLTFAVDGEICSSCPTSSYVLLDNVTSTYSSVLSFTTALSKESGMISCKTKGQQASLDYITYGKNLQGFVLILYRIKIKHLLQMILLGYS